MGTSSLTSAQFWQNGEPHLLVNPLTPHDAEGLLAFVGGGDWCLAQTSGTEGKSKWVALTKRGMLISAQAVNKHLSAIATDRWLVALPIHHVGGFAIYARAFVSGSEVAVFEGKWNAERFTEVCARESISLTSLVPAQVFDLVREKRCAPGCLRAIVVGGGGLSKEVGDAALALGWRVLQSFGMTEACSQIATAPLDRLDAGFDPDALGVLPHWDLSIDADERLILRGQALAHGYVIRDQDGWRWDVIDQDQGLTTRDRVALWSEGSRRFLRFVGRESQALKILGELVYLGPLQAKLDALVMSTGQAVIVPMPDERKGTTLVLATTADDGDALMKQFNSIVAPFERIEKAVRVASLPTTDLGKVKMSELVRQVC